MPQPEAALLLISDLPFLGNLDSTCLAAGHQAFCLPWPCSDPLGSQRPLKVVPSVLHQFHS